MQIKERYCMNEIEKQQVVSKKTELPEIDLLELAQKVWVGKNLIFKACKLN